MNSVLEILLALAVAACVIFAQVRGESLRGKRLIATPLVLAVIGVVELTRQGVHPTGTDIACIAVSAAIALGIGAGQGTTMILQSRAGALWGRMPLRGLWWWAALVASRIAMMVIAHGLDAKVAASATPILLILGINRVGQALVIAPRAMARAISFAPEKDGSTFGSGSSRLSGVLGRLAPPPIPPQNGSPRQTRPVPPQGPVPPQDPYTWVAPPRDPYRWPAPPYAGPAAPAPPVGYPRTDRRGRRRARRTRW